MTMTIHLDCYATTDCKPEVLSGVETGNRIPHDELILRGIAHICTHIQKRRHFYAKTTNANIYMKGLAQC